MRSFHVKKYLLLFSMVQALCLANVHASEVVARRGGEGEEHNRQHSQQHQHSQYQHHQDQYHPSYGEAEQRGSKTGVFVAPQQGYQNQNSGQSSAPDNPLYDSESQQLQQQGQQGY